MDCLETKRGVEMERPGEQGFMLVGLIVAIFLILLALSVAAPKVAQNLRREQEVEAIHRGNQYVRAIRLYTKRGTGPYPATIEQLEKTTNIRYLRQRYVDPITGKDDWRLIHVGEAKTTVKGFFGQPLAGLATGPGAGTGSPIGSNAGGAGQTGLTSTIGSPGGAGGYGASSPGGGGLGSSSGGLGSSSGGLGSTSGGLGSSSGGGLGGSGLGGASTLGGSSSGGLGSSTAGTGTAPSTIGASAGIGGQSASTFSGSAQPFVGVGIPKEGDSITILNEQTTYNTWEMIYDPRIEQLYAKGAMLGAGSNALGSGSGSSIGSSSGSGIGSSGGSGIGSSSSGFGNSPNSGSGIGSGTGLGSGSGMGTMPGSSSPTTPTSPQQPRY
jgi:type II secretory pathway pseudopilin PulG